MKVSLLAALLFSTATYATDLSVYCDGRKESDLPPKCVDYFRDIKLKVAPAKLFEIAKKRLQIAKENHATRAALKSNPELAIKLLSREHEVELFFMGLDITDTDKQEVRRVRMATEAIAQLADIHETLAAEYQARKTDALAEQGAN